MRLSTVLLKVACSLVLLFLIVSIPHILNYQGKIVDLSGVGINDTLSMVFRLYNCESGGVPLWEGSYSDVPVVHGLFSVRLSGFPDSVNFSEQYWLEVEIEGETMSPRERLTSAPYAMRSLFAESGFNPIYSEMNSTRRRGEIVFRAGEGATLADDGATINITLGSTLGVPDLVSVLAAGNDAGGRRIRGLANPVEADDAATKAYVDGYVPSLERVLTVGNDAGGMRIVNLGEPVSNSDAATKSYVDTHSGSGLIGSGISGAVARWTSSNSLGIGIIYDNGSAVGIGTSSPSATFEVNGSVLVDGQMNLSGNRIVNVGLPVEASDVATKAYVDGISFSGFRKIFETDLNNVSSYTVTGLYGDSARVYKIYLQGIIVSSGSDRYVHITPNNLTGNTYTSVFFWFENNGGSYNSGGTLVTNRDGMVIGRSAWGSTGELDFEITLYASSGRNRSLNSRSNFVRQGYTNYYTHCVVQSNWYNSSTNINSLVFDFDGGTYTGKLTIFGIKD